MLATGAHVNLKFSSSVVLMFVLQNCTMRESKSRSYARVSHAFTCIMSAFLVGELRGVQNCVQ